MIQISAGTATPILIATDDASAKAVLVRVADTQYWSGTAWVGAEQPLSTSSFITGVRSYTTPELDSGHYWIIFKNGATVYQQEQVYVGGYLYNSMPNTCIVYGTLSDATGEPVQNTNIYFKPIITSQIIDGSALSLTSAIIRTDVNGEFAIELVRGAQVLIIVEATAYRKTVTIPDQSSVNIKDL
jgi:hypothetical protein